MQRRDFVKLAGLTGISLMFPWASSKPAQADANVWGGPYLLHMHASGGWDPTILCDAKLTASDGTSPIYENKLLTAVTNVNGISIPQTAVDGKFLLKSQGIAVEDPLHFFQNAGKNVLVFNGVDTETNNHETGVQGLCCGHNNIELPALAALFAGMASEIKDVPMAFLASGPYNRTGDVVGVSRFPGDKVPLLIDPFKGGAADEKPLVSDLASRRIMELRNQRLDRIEQQATLPKNRRTLLAVREALKSGGSMALLNQVVNGTAPTIDSFAADLAPDTAPYLTGLTNPKDPKSPTRFIDLGRDLEIFLRCFQAGVAASATYQQGGFDTHGNHDIDQQAAMGTFLARYRYVLLRAAQLGIADKLYVLITSDFGRTPRYNTGNGKDHWNVTSALLSGPNIRGGRAIGKTDDGQKALRVSKADPSQALPDTDESGERLHAGHLHGELRRVLGVDKADFISKFPLPATDDPLPLLA